MNFTVVIPAFNDEASVQRAVDSTLEQAGLDEIIVVDDGSTDRTGSLAASIAGVVRCISQKNAGPAAARNTGAEAALATHLVFLDADDTLTDGALERFAAAHTLGSRLVRAASLSTDEEGSVVLSLPEQSDYPFPRGTPLAGSFSVERELFCAIGGYDSAFRFGENSELLMRLTLALEPSQIGFIDAAAVHIHRRVGRDPMHYDQARLAAVNRMLYIHGATLAVDADTLRSHLLIASNLHRRAGRRREAVRFATRAARVGTPSLRSIYRIGRAAFPHQAPSQ